MKKINIIIMIVFGLMLIFSNIVGIAIKTLLSAGLIVVGVSHMLVCMKKIDYGTDKWLGNFLTAILFLLTAIGVYIFPYFGLMILGTWLILTALINIFVVVRNKEVLKKQFSYYLVFCIVFLFSGLFLFFNSELAMDAGLKIFGVMIITQSIYTLISSKKIAY